MITAVTLLVLVAILGGGAWYGYRHVVSPVPNADPSASCTPSFTAGDLVRARDVTITVFNAGGRDGLAADVQNQLTARGFVQGDSPGNAPSSLGVVRFAKVFTTAENDPAAALVARQFGRNTEIQVTTDELGAGIDVVVGDAFVRLVQAPRTIRVAKAAAAC